MTRQLGDLPIRNHHPSRRPYHHRSSNRLIADLGSQLRGTRSHLLIFWPP